MRLQIDREADGLDWNRDPIPVSLKDVTFLQPFAVIYLGMVLVKAGPKTQESSHRPPMLSP